MLYLNSLSTYFEWAPNPDASPTHDNSTTTNVSCSIIASHYSVPQSLTLEYDEENAGLYPIFQFF